MKDKKTYTKEQLHRIEIIERMKSVINVPNDIDLARHFVEIMERSITESKAVGLINNFKRRGSNPFYVKIIVKFAKVHGLLAEQITEKPFENAEEDGRHTPIVEDSKEYEKPLTPDDEHHVEIFKKILRSGHKDVSHAIKENCKAFNLLVDKLDEDKRKEERDEEEKLRSEVGGRRSEVRDRRSEVKLGNGNLKFRIKKKGGVK